MKKPNQLKQHNQAETVVPNAEWNTIFYKLRAGKNDAIFNQCDRMR